MSPTPPVEPVQVYDSTKNCVLVYQHRVHKTFKAVRYSARHARREVAALRKLAGLDGVPDVLEVGADGMSICVSRVPGVPLSECASVSARTIASLRALVERMLERGVARHSLPPRDVMVRPDGTVGLVDFERSTLRILRGEPTWLVACAVTRFHLLRLIGERAPELLSPRERRLLRVQVVLRAAAQGPVRLKRRIFRRLFPY